MNELLPSSQHQSVLLDEVVEALRPALLDHGLKSRFLDCTLGGGGHSSALLNLSSLVEGVAVDCDKLALERGRERFKAESERLRICAGKFGDLYSILDSSLVESGFAAILADLGLSSDQLNSEDRGFSFLRDGPLDMRMDQTDSQLTAETVVNHYDENALRRVFIVGGVGAESKMIAREIVRRRPVSGTRELAQIIGDLMAKTRGKKTKKPSQRRTNPATVPFQAIRIEVNKEMKEIEGLLDFCEKALLPAGRLAVITFHSLEDKLVTGRMRKWEMKGRVCRGVPLKGEMAKWGELITRRPICPQSAEVAANPRARSARLRVFERTGERI